MGKVPERNLYELVRPVIAGSWARDQDIEPLAVEITASQGRKRTGGVWTRPDIVVAALRTFDFVLPGKHLDIITFEVKSATAISVQAVYEARNHSAAATQSYVLIHVPPDQAGRVERDLLSVVNAARSEGIGLLTVAEPADYGTWRQLAEATRVTPDHERMRRMDAFIATQLSDKTQRLITRSTR